MTGGENQHQVYLVDSMAYANSRGRERAQANDTGNSRIQPTKRELKHRCFAVSRSRWKESTARISR